MAAPLTCFDPAREAKALSREVVRAGRPDGTGEAPVLPVRAAARSLLGKYVKFCVVGGSGMLVDMGALFLLASPSLLGWNLTASKLIAAEIALFNNFAWNDLWTFRDGAEKRSSAVPRLVRLLKFNLICAAGIGLSVGLLNLQVHGFGMNVYAANLIAIVAASVWNFLLCVNFGWNGSGSGESNRFAIHAS